ncbi:MAG: tautomerase family protein [Burkholderiaceae bacterium]|jgi:4-oxalocrotonate tautomerase|nr:tautomerase family protein [Burkholderiaceae bacterium]
MPIVKIEMLPGRGQEAKQKVATEITNVLAREFEVDAAHIYVMFSEVAGGDWAVAGRFLGDPSTKPAKVTS